MADEHEAGRGVRLALAERDIEQLIDGKADKTDVEALKDTVNELRDDFKAVRRALWAFALGLPLGGLALLIAVLSLAHNVGGH